MNENIVKIGVTGQILEGKYKDWFIFVEDDSKNTGGFLILVFSDYDRRTSQKGFDYWAEDKNSLQTMFQEANWKILWIDETNDINTTT